MKVLVISGTGQLGFTIAKKAKAAGHDTYAMYRETSDKSIVRLLDGINLVKGDLTHYQSLEDAVRGMDVVIGCANTATPTRKGDGFGSVDYMGYLNLIDVIRKLQTKQFIYTSAISFENMNHTIPLMRTKRKLEQKLVEAGITYTIIRPAPFMDISFALMGTDIVLNNTEVHTLQRPFSFSRKFFEKVRDDIAVKNKFNYTGKGDRKSSYIAVDDVAEFHIKAIGNTGAYNRIITIGGPQELSPLDVKEIFEKQYGKKLHGNSTSSFLMKIMAEITIPFFEHSGNLLAMNYASTQVDTVVPGAMETAGEFGVKLTSAEEFIRAKM